MVLGGVAGWVGMVFLGTALIEPIDPLNMDPDIVKAPAVMTTIPMIAIVQIFLLSMWWSYNVVIYNYFIQVFFCIFLIISHFVMKK